MSDPETPLETTPASAGNVSQQARDPGPEVVPPERGIVDQGRAVIRTLKLLALLGALVYFGWKDLRFAISGELTDAIVISAGRVGGDNRSIDVRYQFQDPELGQRLEEDNIAHWHDIPRGTVPVEFIPGAPEWSRIDGPMSMFLMMVLYLGGLILVIAIGMFVWSRIRGRVDSPA